MHGNHQHRQRLADHDRAGQRGQLRITGLDTSGSATFGHQSLVGLSASPHVVVSATGVNGNTTVTWNPVIQISIPDGAVAGTYSATVVHSVS